MTQVSNGRPSEQRHDPEPIDLMGLALELWRGKTTIIASVGIVLILAVAYLFVAKEKWVSTAILAEPDTTQVDLYYNALNLTGSEKKQTDKTDIATASVVDVGILYNAALSTLSNTLDNQNGAEKLTIGQVNKGYDFPMQVKYVSGNAKEAQQKLTQFLEQVNSSVATELYTALKGSIDQRIVMLESSLKNQTSVAEEQRTERLNQIKEALKYAEAANITKPQVQQAQYVTQDTMFLLGSDGLKAMIQNESTRPLGYSDKYYLTKNNLLDLQHLNIDPKMFRTMRYVLKPDLPVHRDSPKRAIVLVLAVLLGGMIGAGIVLGRKAVADYHSRN
ncbi:LPS O-antigen chain length determinant protein WzzB [Kluyvera sp. CHPC 1.251]|uniref:LPS O-antigen chain length determinant protein WzzB n=1 Tax=Kluyvera sp. CHPC 1.251 TaxID=2995175 RepID=UPI002FD83A70